MATLSSTGKISGSIGPVTYSNIGGKTIMRAKPGKGGVKQTPATKSSAGDFGKASTISKNIRIGLFPITQGFTDSRMYSRFTAAIFKTLRDHGSVTIDNKSLANVNITQLENFEFHLAHPFENYCTLKSIVELNEEGKVVVANPAFDIAGTIHKVAGSAFAELCFLVTVINPISGVETNSELLKIKIPFTETHVATFRWVSDIVVPESMPVLITTSLFYFRNDRLMGPVGLNSVAFHTCKIIHASIR